MQNVIPIQTLFIERFTDTREIHKCLNKQILDKFFNIIA